MLFEPNQQPQHPQLPPRPEVVITGSSTLTRRLIKDELRDPLIEEALRSAFSIECASLKLSPSKARIPSIYSQKRQLVFEYRNNQPSPGEVVLLFRREVFGRAAIEEALLATDRYIQTGLHDQSSINKTLKFLSLFFDKPLQSEALSRSAMAAVMKLYRDDLERRLRKLFKGAERIPRLDLTSVDDAEPRVSHFGELLHQIQAISILSHSPAQHSQTMDRLESAASDLHLAIFSLWQKALFQGEQETMQRSIHLFKEMARLCAKPSLEDAPPAFWPIPIAPHFQLSSTQPPTEHPPLRGLAPALLAQLPSIIKAAESAALLDQDLRQWRCRIPEPFVFLRNKLFGSVHGIPTELSSFLRELPREIPHRLSDFLKTLCLLRLHGGQPGIAQFAIFACNTTPEERKRISHNPIAVVAARSEDYTALIDFMAAWASHETHPDRQDAAEAMRGRLWSIVGRVLLSQCKRLEDFLVSSVRSDNVIDPSRLTETHGILRDIALDARQLESQSMASYIALATNSLRCITLLIAAKNRLALGQAVSVHALNRIIRQQHLQFQECARVLGDDTSRVQALHKLAAISIHEASKLHESLVDKR